MNRKKARLAWLAAALALTGSIAFAQVDQGRAASSTSVEGQHTGIAGSKPAELEEVVVTGTHIRGEAPAGSTLKVYSHEDLAQSGAGTLDQFARQMVENFSGADTVANSNTNISRSRFNGGGIFNGFQGASFDLHGLGPTATLTLLNGHRLAAGGYDGSLVDSSEIPLSAIDHIDVLADGASAIYGADAVAGVVNVVTRKDFSGAETGLRYGTSTDGGAGEVTGSQLFGTSWKFGNGLINYEYDRQNGLDAADRDYIPNQGGADLLIPHNRRNSVFASVSQDLSESTQLTADGIYSDREYRSHNTVRANSFLEQSASVGDTRFSGITAAIDQAAWRDWHFSLTANYSKLKELDDSTNSTLFAGILQQPEMLTRERTDRADLDLLVTGTLFSLPAGDVKSALGASYRRETFDTYTLNEMNGSETNTHVTPTLRRHISSAYAEVAIPLVNDANAVAWTQRLQISAAGRYDDYSDSGSATNPKVGVQWEPVRGFSLRGTYGKSFRAPDLDQSGGIDMASAQYSRDPLSPSGRSYIVFLNGGNPGLQAERSTSYTAGFDLNISDLPNFNLSATYFHILFKDRIATPPASGANYLGDPTVALFVQRNPPLSLVESYFALPGFTDTQRLGPNAVTAIFDNRFANIVTSEQSGIDLTAGYTWSTDCGQFGLNASVAHLITYAFQPDATIPAVNLVDTYGEPTRWKGRGGLRWSDRGFTTLLSVNYVNGYDNTLFTPSVPIASWVTEDLYLGYSFGKDLPYTLANLRLDLSVQNLTDRAPPYATLPPLLPGLALPAYDSANASPIGRVIAMHLTKQW